MCRGLLSPFRYQCNNKSNNLISPKNHTDQPFVHEQTRGEEDNFHQFRSPRFISEMKHSRETECQTSIKYWSSNNRQASINFRGSRFDSRRGQYDQGHAAWSILLKKKKKNQRAERYPFWLLWWEKFPYFAGRWERRPWAHRTGTQTARARAGKNSNDLGEGWTKRCLRRKRDTDILFSSNCEPLPTYCVTLKADARNIEDPLG